MLTHRTNTLLQDAKNIIKAHRKIDGKSLEWVVFFPPEEETIRLIEVLSCIASDSTDEVPEEYCIGKEMGESGCSKDGIQHPMKLILLSTEEWDWVKQGKMPLPKGWELSQSVAIKTAKH